jgi:N-acetylmuramoyl-L-alanine amidase
MYKVAKIQMIKRIFYIFLVCLCLLIANRSISQTGLGINTVVIDPGHGGKDPGAVGVKKTYEKNVALSVCLKLGALIKSNFPNVKVIYTRSTDEFIGLAARAKKANSAGADLFISIHANAAGSSSASGFESWVLGLHKSKAALEVAKFENSSILMEDDHEQTYQAFDPNDPDAYIALSMRQSAFLDQSLIFAGLIQEDCTKKLGLKNRGVKQAGFMVLYRATMPAVLIELGFLSNAKEEKMLASKEGQEKMAKHIYIAFKNYKQKVDKLDNSIGKGVIENTEGVKEEIKPVKSDSGIVFKVQLATSSTKISTTSSNFKGLIGVEVYISGKFYKYTYGHCKNFTKVKAKLEEVKAIGYDTAFITAFNNGEIMNLQEAINKTNDK